MPSVLVTGGAGYIGSHAVLALLDRGWSVTVVDDLSTGMRHAVPDGAAFHVANVGDGDRLVRIMKEHAIDAVMHFAGSIIVPESVSNPLKYYRNNTGNSAALIDATLAAGVAHFIFSSTAAVYGVPSASPIDETTIAAPINPYGWSKLMTERMLADAAAAHGFNYCALRYFNVAGADPDGRSGQSTANATHLIKVAVQAALGTRDTVGIFGKDYDTHDGTGVRDYIHVSDLAEAHVLALEKLLGDPEESMVLNCGYGRGYSVLEVLDAVERVSGVALERVSMPRRDGDPGILVADPASLLAALPWEPRYDALEIIVSHAMDWEQRLIAAQAGRTTPHRST